MSDEGSVVIITPEESWHCHTLPETQIEEQERNTTLGALYRLWRNVRGNGIPNEDQFDPNAVLGDADLEGFMRISTEAPNPMNYTFDTSQSNDTAGQMTSIGGLDHSIQSRELIIDLLFCRQLRTPIFQDINHAISMAEYHYRRLLLPVENSAGIVSGIFLCHRMLEADENQPHETAFL